MTSMKCTRFQIAAFSAVTAALLCGCDLSFGPPKPFAIQQINPDIVRADDSTELTITGAGFGDVERVEFSFSKRPSDPAFHTAAEINAINTSTLEVSTPELPGIDESVSVWVSVAGPSGESDPFEITFRPPNAVDLYGIQTAIGIGAVTGVIILGLVVRRATRRYARSRTLWKAKSLRLEKRAERSARAVLAELERERLLELERHEAEYLPYLDKASESRTER